MIESNAGYVATKETFRMSDLFQKMVDEYKDQV